MIPPDYQAVAVRLARLGRNDAYALVEAAMAGGVPALELLCRHLDATLARYRALPALSLSNGPECTNTAKVPPKAAQPVQAARIQASAPIEALPAVPGQARPEPAKHGADDAAARAQLRAAMQAQGPPQEAAPEPTPEPDSLPKTVIEEPPAASMAPVHQLPVVANGGQLYLDSVAALAALGYSRSEARRMAKVAVEHGAPDVGAVIKACTRKAK